jgi:thiol-disulfide isomerase/thioredoxin
MQPNSKRVFLRRVLTLCAVGAHAAASAKTPGEVGIGELLRDATMQGLNGPARKLSEFRGKPLIINVWASWCGPCVAEMASLERLAWSGEAGRFTIIGISTDDYPDAAKALLKRSNATISHFIDSRLLLENMLGASRIPLTVLVDAEGRVLEKVYGARQWDSPQALRMIGAAFRRQSVAPKR